MHLLPEGPQAAADAKCGADAGALPHNIKGKQARQIVEELIRLTAGRGSPDPDPAGWFLCRCLQLFLSLVTTSESVSLFARRSTLMVRRI